MYFGNALLGSKGGAGMNAAGSPSSFLGSPNDIPWLEDVRTG